MTEIQPLTCSGPAPFGYRKAGLWSWEENAEEQMIIEYMAGLHEVGESLRRIAATVKHVYGQELTHAGVDKILKRRKQMQTRPLEQKPHKASITTKPLSRIRELYSEQDSKQILEQPLTFDDVFSNVASLINASALELGQDQVQTLLLRIKLGSERITDSINCWDDSLLKLIEGSYQHALARQAYLRETTPEVQSSQPPEFKPCDVIEFAGTKWYRCGDWDYSHCHKYTQDPKAAGWHKSEYDDDEWECEACWQKDFFRPANITYRSGHVELSMGDKSRKFTKAELTKLIKALEEEKKPIKAQKIKLSLFKEWLKGASQDFQRSHSCGSSLRLDYEDQKKIKAKDSDLLDMQYELLNFDPASLPPIPETIKI